MTQSLKIHHVVWLENHPNRTKQWLLAQMADGFHIHHVDDNHKNNDPKNLVLIEGVDHYACVHGYSHQAAHNKIRHFTFKGRGKNQQIAA